MTGPVHGEDGEAGRSQPRREVAEVFPAAAGAVPAERDPRAASAPAPQGQSRHVVSPLDDG
jgi:hypothetical protein